MTSALASAAAACGGTVATVPSLPTEVLNGEYAGIFAEPVRLTDGRYEGAPFVPGGASRPRLTLVRDVAARGDIDGDGQEELAVLLAESSGGSGTWLHLVLWQLNGGQWLQTATAPLGDRVRVLSLDIRNETLEASLLVHGDADPACCPTQPLTRAWMVAEPGVVEVS